MNICISILLTVGVCFVIQVRSLECNNCSPQISTGCEETECQYLSEEMLEYFQSRSAAVSRLRDIPEPVCYSFNKDVNGTMYGTHSCSPLGHEVTCDYLGEKHGKLKNCKICDTDLCNDQSHMQIPTENYMPGMIDADVSSTTEFVASPELILILPVLHYIALHLNLTF